MQFALLPLIKVDTARTSLNNAKNLARRELKILTLLAYKIMEAAVRFKKS
tara:strand:+ start:338 stop:487 length:150 start_codon:yes stop_codon:yes gene_type:complete